MSGISGDADIGLDAAGKNEVVKRRSRSDQGTKKGAGVGPWEIGT
jgi:hypothetical protein